MKKIKISMILILCIVCVTVLMPLCSFAESNQAYYQNLVEQGKDYYFGTGNEGYSQEKARACFKEAAGDGHNGEAWYYFGNMLMNCTEDERYERAMGSYERAVDYGCGLGTVGQAFLYEYGYGVDKDYEKALKLYTQAVKNGCVEGYNGIANAYRYGHVVQQDDEKAMECYHYAVDGTDFLWSNFAKCQIGDMYAEGYPNGQANYEAAMKWYRKAAEEGYGGGYLRIGNLYYKGQGVEEDKEEAYYWFKKAADHGNVAAMYNVAFMSQEGIGTATDAERAYYYYQTAANLGDADSMYELGVMIKNGLEIPENYETAMQYFNMAISYADNAELIQDAKQEIEKLEARKSVYYDVPAEDTYVNVPQSETINNANNNTGVIIDYMQDGTPVYANSEWYDADYDYLDGNNNDYSQGGIIVDYRQDGTPVYADDSRYYGDDSYLYDDDYSQGGIIVDYRQDGTPVYAEDNWYYEDDSYLYDYDYPQGGFIVDYMQDGTPVYYDDYWYDSGYEQGYIIDYMQDGTPIYGGY